MEKLISDLGSIEENIKENYTSEKLFLAADLPLYNGIELVLKHTDLFEEFISAYYAYNTRKYKYTYNEDVDILLYKFFNCSYTKKIDVIKRFKFNRDILSLPLGYIAENTDAYILALISDNNEEAWQIARLMKFKTYKDITSYLLQIKNEYKRYQIMKEAIIQKFYRLIVQQVHKNINKSINTEDMAVEYYRALLKAYSRFDVSSGTFTSYVTNWFRNAKAISQEQDEIGVAFTIPSNIRVQIARGKSDIVNYSVQEEEETLAETQVYNYFDNSTDFVDMEAIAQIIDKIDITGIYRLINDLEFNPYELIESLYKKSKATNAVNT